MQLKLINKNSSDLLVDFDSPDYPYEHVQAFKGHKVDIYGVSYNDLLQAQQHYPKGTYLKTGEIVGDDFIIKPGRKIYNNGTIFNAGLWSPIINPKFKIGDLVAEECIKLSPLCDGHFYSFDALKHDGWVIKIISCKDEKAYYVNVGLEKFCRGGIQLDTMRNVKPATPEQINHLERCIMQNEYVPIKEMKCPPIITKKIPELHEYKLPFNIPKI